ncbi:MAG: hypothetical protein ACRELF_08730, partial [Gemmataceae bacterium]
AGAAHVKQMATIPRSRTQKFVDMFSPGSNTNEILDSCYYVGTKIESRKHERTKTRKHGKVSPSVRSCFFFFRVFFLSCFRDSIPCHEEQQGSLY